MTPAGKLDPWIFFVLRTLRRQFADLKPRIAVSHRRGLPQVMVSGTVAPPVALSGKAMWKKMPQLENQPEKAM